MQVFSITEDLLYGLNFDVIHASCGIRKTILRPILSKTDENDQSFDYCAIYLCAVDRIDELYNVPWDQPNELRFSAL